MKKITKPHFCYVKCLLNYGLRKKEGYLKGVWHRKDLGDISLVWGEATTRQSGKGLAHIIKKHIETYDDFENIEEAQQIIDDVINNGALTLNEEGRAYLEKDGYRIVVAKDNEGQWVLTAFDTTRTKKGKKKGAAAVRTPGQPANTEGAGAVAPNLSDGKDSETLVNEQDFGGGKYPDIETSRTFANGRTVSGRYTTKEAGELPTIGGTVHIKYTGHSQARRKMSLQDLGMTREDILGDRESYEDKGFYDGFDEVDVTAVHISQDGLCWMLTKKIT